MGEEFDIKCRTKNKNNEMILRSPVAVVEINVDRLFSLRIWLIDAGWPLIGRY